MTKNTIKLIFILVITTGFILGLIFFLSNRNETQQTTSSQLNLTTIEIADEDNEYSRGLMNRKDLCEKCGMLFIFKTEMIRSFWMKNTFIPLDIIFIDKEGRIQQIHSNTKTNQTSQTYGSVKPITYVLEVNSGFSEKNNLEKGSLIDISELRKNGIDYQY